MKPIKHRFKVKWLPKGKIITTPNYMWIGNWFITERLWHHETVHIMQWRFRIEQFGEIDGRIAFLLYDWVWQWIRAGFNYSEIPAEIEARKAEEGKRDVIFLTYKD